MNKINFFDKCIRLKKKFYEVHALAEKLEYNHLYEKCLELGIEEEK